MPIRPTTWVSIPWSFSNAACAAILSSSSSRSISIKPPARWYSKRSAPSSPAQSRHSFWLAIAKRIAAPGVLVQTETNPSQAPDVPEAGNARSNSATRRPAFANS